MHEVEFALVHAEKSSRRLDVSIVIDRSYHQLYDLRD